jgi:hypothetical protein
MYATLAYGSSFIGWAVPPRAIHERAGGFGMSMYDYTEGGDNCAIARNLSASMKLSMIYGWKESHPPISCTTRRAAEIWTRQASSAE